MVKFISEKVEGYCIVDENTGEIRDLIRTKKVDQDEFILFFLQSIPEIMELEGNQIKMLVILWKLSSFNRIGEVQGNVVYNNLATKNQIRELGLNLTNKSIDMYFSQLCKNGILLKRCRGSYILNPMYFFKGNISDATNMQILITSELSDKDSTKTAPIVKKQA